MFGPIDIVLVTASGCISQNAVTVWKLNDVQDADSHTRARNGGKANSSTETLVTLGVVVLQADLKLDGLNEVPLLGLIAVLKELFIDVSCTLSMGRKRHYPLHWCEHQQQKFSTY